MTQKPFEFVAPPQNHLVKYAFPKVNGVSASASLVTNGAV